MRNKKIFLCLLFAVISAAAAMFVCTDPSSAQQPGRLINPRLVVSCFLGDSMTSIDARTVRVNGEFSVGTNPEYMAVSPDNRYIAVAQPKNGCISIVATDNMRFGNAYSDPQIKKPVAVTFSVDSSRLYVLDADTCSLAELHVPSFQVVRMLPLNGLGPSRMCISKNGSKLFISHESTGLITVVNLFEWNIFKQMGVGPAAGGIALSKDNGRLAVALPSESKVGIYKTTDLRLITKVPVGNGAGPVGISAKDQVVVVNTISNDVSIFDLDHPASRIRATVGTGPMDICFSPDGSMCYITNFNTNDLSVIDMSKGVQLGRLAIGKGPKGVVWVY